MIERIIRSVKQVNEEIKKDINLGTGYQIGHSYFCANLDGMDESDWFREVVGFEINAPARRNMVR